MRKLILYIALSLDGYIARSNGDVDWLVGDGSNPAADFKYDEFYQRIDTVILGRTTYEQILGFGAYPYPGTQGYVYSTTQTGCDENVTFVSTPPAALLAAIREKPGKDLWLVGGSQLAQDFISQNLVDEYSLCIMPTLLGEGIPLFQGGFSQTDLTLVSSESANGCLLVRYKRRQDFSG